MIKIHSKNRKGIMFIMSAVLVILTIIFMMVCSVNITYAEESNDTISPRGSSQSSINVPLIGEFKDGKRLYGGYVINFNVTNKGNNEYLVDLELQLHTYDYSLDDYHIESFAFYFYGNNVIKDNVSKKEVKTAYGDYKGEFKDNGKGILGYEINLIPDELNKHNNIPILRHIMTVKITGGSPTIGVAINSMSLIGKGLAKDTVITDKNFVTLDMQLFPNFNLVTPYYKYMPNYNGKTFVSAAYGTWYGPIPYNWPEPSGSLR